MEPNAFISMLSLAGAVFAASLVGSAHCAGMCGGLVLLAVSPDGTARKPWSRQFAYHGGRGIGYTLLGVLAGAIGLSMQSTAKLAGVQHAAAWVAGAAMILIGIAMAWHALGWSMPRFMRSSTTGSCPGSGPGPWRLLATALHRRAFRLDPTTRAFAIGLLTPMLPCGWLYLFAITAAGTASPVLGGVVMASFWLGTVPILAALGAGLGLLTGPIRKRLPVVGALLVVALGLLTVTGRLSIPASMTERMLADAQGGMIAASLNGDGNDDVGSSGTSVERALKQIRGIDDSALPCCNPTGDVEGTETPGIDEMSDESGAP
jgi:sulfite exporter TauE/SafE